MPKTLKMVLLGTMIVQFSSCAKNPVTGKRQLALISEQQEIAIGQASHPQVLAQFGRVEDEALQSFFQGLGEEMAAISHRPELDWHFTVVDSPVVNAFAVPGGYVYFTRGILAHMNNEAELAGVLGHEIGHITARHSVTQISQSQLIGLGLGLGSVFSPTFRNFGGLAQTGLSLLFLKYSRAHESQSDQLGVQYMSDVDYDPRQLSKFFEVFERMRERSGQSIPNWVSSHPDPANRVRATAQSAERIVAERDEGQFKTNQSQFLARLDGQLYGENPREGFVEGGVFYHPDLRFQMEYPSRWQVDNGKSAVVFAEPNGEAALRLTLAPAEFATAPEQRAQALASQEAIVMEGGRSLRIGGNPAYLALYNIQQQPNLSIRALAAFISYSGNLYEWVGMTLSSRYQSYQMVFEQALTSFDRLRDRDKLNVQPDRLRIVRARRGQTLRQLARSSSRVSLEELAFLNRVTEDQPLEQGRPIKIVELGR